MTLGTDPTTSPDAPPAAAGGDGAAPVAFSAADLGFEPLPDGGWQRHLGDSTVRFRELRRLPDLLPVEGLQRDVFGVSDRDLIPASELVVVPETGGAVIGAFLDGAADPVAVVVGWGGFVAGRPRLVSDLLAVRAAYRNRGFGAELKRLQAAVALAAGFPEIVWTVDPLRAANARLNFDKLGAVADRYEEDRYGTGFGAGLYGTMPTDRLHLSWDLTAPRVRARLLGHARPSAPAEVADLTHFALTTDAPRALVSLPADIDRLLADDPNAALRWRLTLRETLQLAFAAGYAITGFAPPAADHDHAAYVIEPHPPANAVG